MDHKAPTCTNDPDLDHLDGTGHPGQERPGIGRNAAGRRAVRRGPQNFTVETT
ncbi:hypothetical protein GCM10010211_53090 [Streptomyces albospinus]|uniref:Uncharacterized protein n=1 Tax=Streptomyces albospinus TaxID=285515 RepID=A0ABQ2VFA0_9ACTN|nr:hypothetical protein GCM10010211_53090 [Streptomyces albospinus]